MSRRPSTTLLLSAACVGVLGVMLTAASTARAQSTVGSTSDSLRRVDQGIADRSALSTSLRTFGVDLRAPVGFYNLYQLPSEHGRAGQYVRQSGAISAVFPQSTYVFIEESTHITIPPGTVFYIGDVPSTSSTHTATATSPTALYSGLSTSLDSRADSLSVSTQVSTRPIESQPRPETNTSTTLGILTDESYRASRVAQILADAAQ